MAKRAGSLEPGSRRCIRLAGRMNHILQPTKMLQESEAVTLPESDPVLVSLEDENITLGDPFA